MRRKTYPFVSGSKAASPTAENEVSLRSMGALSKTAGVIIAIGHGKDDVARRCGGLFVCNSSARASLIGWSATIT
jgi:hypothetical protein